MPTAITLFALVLRKEHSVSDREVAGCKPLCVEKRHLEVRLKMPTANKFLMVKRSYPC